MSSTPNVPGVPVLRPARELFASVVLPDDSVELCTLPASERTA